MRRVPDVLRARVAVKSSHIRLDNKRVDIVLQTAVSQR
jgi:hypothetical protein